MAEVHVFGAHRVQEMKEGLNKEMAQVFFRAPRENQGRLGVQFAGGHHGAHGVVVGVEVSGDNGLGLG